MIHDEIIAGSHGREGLDATTRATGGPHYARIAVQKGEAFTLAYATNLSHRLPLLYCVLLFDTLILSITFYGTAPAILVLWLPIPFMAVNMWRAAYWLPSNVRKRPLAVLSRDIKRLPNLGAVVSLVPLFWSLALYSYGNQQEQSLVHYITAVTCFTGILSLGQSPRTAIMMAAVVIIPSSIFYLSQDHPNSLTVIAVQIVGSILLVLITTSYHVDFVDLELSRQELARRKNEFKQLAETHRQSAIRDPLTGANNRRSIMALVGQALEGSAKGPWLALVDLDGFKHINDTYGHAAGDAVLCAVSQRIGAVPEIDTFGRMGGDEFALLISGERRYPEVRSALDRLCLALCQPIKVHDLKLAVKVSVGLHRCRSTDLNECLERADTALYKAKDDRRGGVARFTASDERSLRERRVMTRVFTLADLDHQLALVYQPVIDSDTGRPVAFEALVRWSPDGKKFLPPAAFINLAETTGRIGELTEIVLAKALDEFRAWQWGCKLAINLSAHDILREDVAKTIAGIVAAAAAPPNGIILEITETAMLKDYRRAADNLAKLRGMGFLIALDDFGTGQSSLSHVHNLPIDSLKIDQSFARDLGHCERARAIVGTILMLARQLRLECTIEGIESLEQQTIARSLGVRTMQGYLFGRPVRAAEAFGEANLKLLGEQCTSSVIAIPRRLNFISPAQLERTAVK